MPGKIILLLGFLCLSFCKADAQAGCQKAYDSVTAKQVYTYVDSMPSFPGGMSAFMGYFRNHYHYEFKEGDDLYQSFHFIFIVDTDGTLKGVRADYKEVRQPTEAEKAGLNVIANMSGWIPGKCNGKAVPVLVRYPVKIHFRD